MKPSGERDLAPRGARRLEDDGGDIVARRERIGDATDIVGRQQDGLFDEAGAECRPARRPRNATWRPAPRRRASRESGRRSG